MAGDLATLWQLVEGGLTRLPRGVAESDADQTMLLEAVWNNYAIDGRKSQPGIEDLGASDGGVDLTQPTPWYQTAYGLTPRSVNPGPGRHGTRRAGRPGQCRRQHVVHDAGHQHARPAASPTAPAPPRRLWAALVAQLNTIFEDQGLPHLGYMNDLLYIAAAIAPASFNDITFGNNISSFSGRRRSTSDGEAVTLTGFGYHAGPGYDLTTGLGTPNGPLLARALSAIAHSQMSFGTSPDMLDARRQRLAERRRSEPDVPGDVRRAPPSTSAWVAATWASARPHRGPSPGPPLAQQSLQADFDPNLVRLFDRQAQGSVGAVEVTAGEDVSVTVDGTSAQAIQGTLSAPSASPTSYPDGAVRVARPVAVAETAGGGDDQVAIVRVRQNGENNLSLIFYEVDDLPARSTASGRAMKAMPRRPLAGLSTGAGRHVAGRPGLRQLRADRAPQCRCRRFHRHEAHQPDHRRFLLGLRPCQRDGGRPVGRPSVNYGLNTWGWEDMYGGGDRDFNDLIVQLDFTSAAGNGWLV